MSLLGQPQVRLAGDGLLAAGFLDAAVCMTIRIGLLRHVQEGSSGEEAGKGGEARHDDLQMASGKWVPTAWKPFSLMFMTKRS
ncbi:hypothetical protein [Pseudomonas knackmussii]|uniref:hypothetical protein n=1 Tax=Pseudomonas knackmussii TaxID=65741 RepID=UPI003F4A5935